MVRTRHNSRRPDADPDADDDPVPTGPDDRRSATRGHDRAPPVAVIRRNVIAELASVSFPALGTTALLCVTDAAGLPAAHEPSSSASWPSVDARLQPLPRRLGARPPERRRGRPLPVGALLYRRGRGRARGGRGRPAGLVDPTVGRSLRLAGYDRRFATRQAPRRRSFRARFAPVPGLAPGRARPAARTIALAARGRARPRRDGEGARGRPQRARGGAASGSGVLVSLGGDVAVARALARRGWPVRIADDHAAALDHPGLTVAIEGGGLATSGTTVRRWLAGDRELHHIVDPATGRAAATPWRTVTVAASTLRGRECRQHGSDLARRAGARVARSPWARGEARADSG